MSCLRARALWVVDSPAFGLRITWPCLVNRRLAGCSWLTIMRFTLSHRQVSKEEGEQKAKELNVMFIETSAKGSVLPSFSMRGWIVHRARLLALCRRWNMAFGIVEGGRVCVRISSGKHSLDSVSQKTRRAPIGPGPQIPLVFALPYAAGYNVKQLFRRVASALPGMENAPEPNKNDCMSRLCPDD